MLSIRRKSEGNGVSETVDPLYRETERHTDEIGYDMECWFQPQRVHRTTAPLHTHIHIYVHIASFLYTYIHMYIHIASFSHTYVHTYTSTY